MAALGSPEWSTFVAAHRARAARRRDRDGRDSVLIFARTPAMLRWIEHELFGQQVSSTAVDSICDLVARLTLSPSPRYLIIDIAEIPEAEHALLGAIRESGWSGVVIAVGDPCERTQRSLGVDVVLPRSYEIELLRNAMKQARPVRSAPQARLRLCG